MVIITSIHVSLSDICLKCPPSYCRGKLEEGIKELTLLSFASISAWPSVNKALTGPHA